jgi:hypothetical protein
MMVGTAVHEVCRYLHSGLKESNIIGCAEARRAHSAAASFSKSKSLGLTQNHTEAYQRMYQPA